MGGLLFDIGANVGLYAEANFDRFDRIVCVEPLAAECDTLRRRFEGSGGKVTVVNGFVSDDPDAVFHENVTDGQLSTACTFWRTESRFGHMAASWQPRPDVARLTLDGLVREHGRPDYIKVDVEGHESHVLNTMTVPYCPLSFEWAEEAHEDMSKSCALLLALGYREFVVQYRDDYTWQPRDDSWRSLDHFGAFLAALVPARKAEWGMVHVR